LRYLIQHNAKGGNKNMHPHTLHELSKYRQQDYMREAEQHRLVKQARAGRPSQITRSQEKLGGYLIKIGAQLLKRPGKQMLESNRRNPTLCTCMQYEAS
jgi:hypothetical protein